MNKRSAAKASFSEKANGAAARGRLIQAHIDRLDAVHKKPPVFGNKELLDYSMTKGGIHAFTRSLATHLADLVISFRSDLPLDRLSRHFSASSGRARLRANQRGLPEAA